MARRSPAGRPPGDHHDHPRRRQRPPTPRRGAIPPAITCRHPGWSWPSATRSLARARPRFVAVDGAGRAIEDDDLLEIIRIELSAIRAGSILPAGSDNSPIRVPMTLEGQLVGGLVAIHDLPAPPEPGDISVLRVLANQAAVALHTSEQYQAGLELHQRAQRLDDEATEQHAI